LDRASLRMSDLHFPQLHPAVGCALRSEVILV